MSDSTNSRFPSVHNFRHSCYEGRSWAARHRAARASFSEWPLISDGCHLRRVVGVHGGVKFYRGAARAARAYVERDHSRADDYYLGEGSGVATRLTATADGVEDAGSMTGEVYERWVAGLDVDSGHPKGRLRTD